MIYLNARSHFSIGESLLTPKQIVECAAVCGVTSVAVTDTMRISALAELVKAAKDKGIKPIIGARLRIVDALTHDKDSKKTNKPYYVRAIVRTEDGYRALLKLLSLAFDKEHFYEVPRLLITDVASVLGAAGESATLVTLGDIYSAIAAGKGTQCVATLRAAGVAVVSEIVPLPLPHYMRQAKEALKLYSTEKVPVITALPAFYSDAAHAETLDLARVIGTPGAKVGDWVPPHHWRDFTPQDVVTNSALRMKFVDAMARQYPALTHSQWHSLMMTAEGYNHTIADSCTYVWQKDPPSLPKMAPNEFQAVCEACQKGWRERFSKPVYGHIPLDLTPYKERLAYELGILKKLKFEGYFLLVSEIINWSKANGIAVGPGRGSVGGSLVAYLMGITDIDPLRFDLLFERFINPDRIDLPDADLDFMGTRREEVVAWVKSRFGEAHVAAVSNYMVMRPAQALKSLCRVMNVPEAGMAFSKLVPKEHGVSFTLDEAIKEMPELAKFADEQPKIVGHARILEDRMSGYGKHAAGIIVADVPINERAVVETREGEAIINWDKRLAEDFGLVKIDVLGLSTLDMIEVTLRHIFKMRGKRIDIHDIVLDDPDVLKAFGNGETIGVFQFESGGMRKLLKNLAEQAPLTFEDLTAATALYRPGPMDSGQLEGFVEIKQGLKSPSYYHPSMENALKETYGVIVYQEQVMQLSRDFAGFTLVQADHLRKIMGKKEKDKMKEWRERFVEGAVATHGVNPKFAEEIFDKIAAFAGYGFNKSHASAYALISYICMWLKVKYPVEFFAGTLTHVKSDKWSGLLADMRRLGLKLQPPDINISTGLFEPLNDTTLLAPFNAIKGVSDNTSNAILAARAAGPFKDKADFIARVEKRKCNSGHQGKLDLVGAFARIEPGQQPADHADRRRDQLELMGGLIDGAVIIDRPMNVTQSSLDELTQVVENWRACDLCELKGLCHPRPGISGVPRLMVVTDGPNYKEEAADQIGNGGHMEAIFEACDHAGIMPEEIYFTTLIKSPKPERAKEWSNKTLAECPVWLSQEISALRPPVILALGSKTANYLVKDLRGGVTDNKGKVIYDKARDTNIVIGFAPGQIHYHPEMQQDLNEIMAKIPELLPLT